MINRVSFSLIFRGNQLDEKLIRKQVELKFDMHFTDFWKKIINYNTLRNQINCKMLGSPQNYVIIQAIAWHHYLAKADEAANRDDYFKNTIKGWTDIEVASPARKLSISLVSELTNIPFETTRRHIKKLVKKDWIKYSKNTGIVINSSSKLNKIIINTIHPYEKKLLMEAIVAFLMINTDN